MWLKEEQQNVGDHFLFSGCAVLVAQDQDVSPVTHAPDTATTVSQEETLEMSSMDQSRLHTRFPFWICLMILNLN